MHQKMVKSVIYYILVMKLKLQGDDGNAAIGVDLILLLDYLRCSNACLCCCVGRCADRRRMVGALAVTDHVVSVSPSTSHAHGVSQYHETKHHNHTTDLTSLRLPSLMPITTPSSTK